MSKTYYTGFFPNEDAVGAKGSAAFLQYTAELSIYIRSLAAPLLPTGGSYSFIEGLLTPPTDWSSSIPAGADPVWVSYARLTTYNRKDLITTIEWSTPVELFKTADDPITVRITNPTVIVPADSNGQNQVVTNSGTAIYVYEGDTLLEYDGVGGSESRWRIDERIAENINIGTIAADSVSYAIINDIQSMSGDKGSVRYIIKGFNKKGTSFSIEVAQNFTRLNGIIVDITPPGVVTGLTLSSSTITLPGGGIECTLNAAWNNNTEEDLSYYEVEIKETASGDFINYQTGSNSYTWRGVKSDTQYSVRVRAVDKSNNKGAYSSVVQITTAKDSTPPAVATNLQATATYKNVYLSWTNPGDYDLNHVDIYEHTSNDSLAATKIGSAPAAREEGGTYTRVGLPYGATRYYWIKTVDTSGNTSGFSNVAPATTLRLAQDDIADSAINVAKFASGLEPVTVVSSVPTEKSTNTIFNTSNGKLYRWNGTAYTVSVPTSDLAGTIVGTQIENGAITTEKMTANSIEGDRIKANSLDASKIVADSITAGQIQAGAIGATEIAAQAITADKLLIGAPGSALNIDPGFLDSSAWTLFGGIAPTYATVSDGKVGNSVARSNGTDMVWANEAKKVPLDPSKTYRVRGWMRTVAGSGKVAYLGVALFDSAGTNITGDGSQWYYAASSVNPGVDWTEYVGSFGAGTGKPIPANARTMSPLYILSYGGSGNSQHEIQDLRIEEVLPATLIKDGAITTSKMTADSINGDRIAAGTLHADKITASTLTADRIQVPASGGINPSIQVGGTGVTLGTVQTNAATGAQDPATRINSGTTTIDPGKILISGSTYLSSWRNGTDNTKIEGGSIAANTITANKLTIGSRGIDISGLEFQAQKVASNRVDWTQGTLVYTNDNGNIESVDISAGNVTWSSGVLYIYWNKGDSTLNASTGTGDAYGANKIVLATYMGGTNLIVNYGRTIIDGSQITTGTLSADRLLANTTLTANLQIGSSNFRIDGAAQGAGKGTLVVNNGTSDLIKLGYINSNTVGFQLYNASGETLLSSTTPASSINNSSISISSNGTLNGGGGGSVTISGLGYTGALDANKTYIDGNGQIQGVSSGAGTTVSNSAITISGGAISGIGTGTGTAVANSAITISNSGALSGAGGGQVTLGGIGFTGDTDAQRNSRITIASGQIQGIGTGAGTTVDNSAITLVGGQLQGIGTGSGSYVIKNLEEASSWMPGSTPPWGLNGNSNENSIVWGTGPRGGIIPLWKCTSSGDGNADGGWNHGGSFKVDKNKTYRFMLPVKMEVISGTAGSAYLGIDGGAVCDLNTTNKNYNPYFHAISRSNFSVDKWYLMVGFIYPANSTGLSNTGAHIYDMTTGAIVANGTNYCWASDVTTCGTRAYQYYANTAGNIQYFSAPTVEVVDGSESSINEVLQSTAILNQNITISSGQIQGIGIGSGTTVDNNAITVDANGVLQGTGTSNIVVNNTFLETQSFVTTGTTVIGNTIKKTATTGDWDSQAYSKDGYTNGAFASFSPDQTGVYQMAGLNTDPSANASYDTIDYAFYMNGTSDLRVYESSADRGSVGTYAVGDILSVTYDGSRVQYIKNGTVLRTVTVTISNPLYFDSSFVNPGASISKVRFGPMSSNNWDQITNQPAGIYNSNITISSGAISGIGTGSGTVVANNVITMSSNGTINNAGGGQVTLGGIGFTGDTDAQRNSRITIASGQIQGIGTGAGTEVANSNITISSGALNGIGTGTGTVVANSAISISSGQLQGIGTGNGTAVANSQISISSNGTLNNAGGGQVTLSGVGFTGDTDAQRNSRITVSSGQLSGIGTTGVYVDNTYTSTPNNLIPNSDQTSSITMVQGWNPNGATFDATLQYASNVGSGWVGSYILSGVTTRNLYVHQNNITAGGDDAVALDIYPTGGWDTARIPVQANEKYIFSCYLQGHRCKGAVGIGWWDAAGAQISSVESGPQTLPYGQAAALSQYSRVYTIGTAPSNAASASLFIRKYNTIAGNTESYFWLAAPMFERVNSNTATPGPYVPGPALSTRQLGYSGDLNATNGATIGSNLNGQFTESNISSNFASNSIPSTYIKDLAANKISAGTVSVGVSVGDNKVKLDGANRQITIRDTNNVVRVKIGDLSV